MKKLELVAVFLIALVLSLIPIQGISAASLNIRTIQGQDNVSNYVRAQSDRLNIIATADIPGETIENDQLKVFIDGTEQRIFNSCSATGTPGKYICSYTDDIISLSNPTYEYEVKLFTDTTKSIPGASPLLSQTEILRIDLLSPKIKRFSIEPAVSAGGEVAISFDAEDYATSIGDSHCSGLETMRLYILTDNGTQQHIRNVSLDGCSTADFYPYTPLSEEKTYTICGVASDRLGHESDPSCDDLRVDSSGPSLQDLLILDEEGNEVKYATGKTDIIVDVLLNITDDELDPETVFADFSKVTSLTGFERISPSEYSGAETITFVWQGISFDQFPCELSVSAEDSAGNVVTHTLSCGITVDETSPVIASFRSNFFGADDVPLIGLKNTELSVVFTEDGIGFNKSKAYLDLDQIMGEFEVKADRCEKRGAFWECYWPIIPFVSDGNYSVYVSELTQDDLGNKLQEGQKFDVIVDRTSPLIVNITQSLDPVTSADSLLFNFRVENSQLPPKVLIDVSEISPITAPVISLCSRERSKVNWTCEANVPTLNKEFSVGRVAFEATDAAGNEFTAYYPITVYEADVLSTPSFFEVSSVTAIPPEIDIKVAQQITTSFFVQVHLEARSPQDPAHILSQSVSCSGMENLTEAPYILNEPSESPIIVIKPATSFVGNMTEGDTLDIECSLNMFVRKGNRVYKNWETENITASVVLYGNRLGEIGDNMQERIQAIQASIYDLDDTISDWDHANDILADIATIATLITEIHAIIELLVVVLWAVALILWIIGQIPILEGLKQAGNSLWDGVCEVSRIANVIVYNVFWVPGPIASLLGALTSATGGAGALNLITAAVLEGLAGVMKMITIILTCQLCDYDDIVGLAVNSLEDGATYEHDDMKGQPSDLEAFTVYKWDPYKSIHVSSACLCIPGIVYNMKKEQQIKCIYKNCVVDHAKRGLPIDSCDVQHKELECLYVDGAAWTIAGAGLFLKFQLLLTYIINTLPTLIAGLVWTVACYPGEEEKILGGIMAEGAIRETFSDSFSCKQDKDIRIILAASKAFCSGLGGPLELTETQALTGNKFDWEAFRADLEGTDYCKLPEYNVPTSGDPGINVSDVNVSAALAELGVTVSNLTGSI